MFSNCNIKAGCLFSPGNVSANVGIPSIHYKLRVGCDVVYFVI